MDLVGGGAYGGLQLFSQYSCESLCSNQGQCSSSGKCKCSEGFASDNCDMCATGYRHDYISGDCMPCAESQAGDHCEVCAAGFGLQQGECRRCVLFFHEQGITGNQACQINWSVILAISGSVFLLMVGGAAAGIYWFRRRRQKRLVALYKQQLEAALWEGDEDAVMKSETSLKRLHIRGDSIHRIELEIEQLRKTQSLEAGVSVDYILNEFRSLANEWCPEKEDPTFYDLKDAFWQGARKLGEEFVCPRDHRKGVALVDMLPSRHY